MTIWDAEPLTPVGLTFAGGTATLGEINEASRRAMEMVDNLNASDAALEEAYQARIDAVKRATGVEMRHPLRAMEVIPALPGLLRFDMTQWREQRQRDFESELRDLEGRFPDRRREIRAQVPITEDAKFLARQAGERLAELTASRDDTVMPMAAAFAGGVEGMGRDPLQVASVFLGGGAGGARTIGGRILATAFREAVVNGAVEAGLQPWVQQWRAEVGLPSGFEEGARNVAFAAGAGAVLGGLGRAAGEAAERFLAGKPPREALDGITGNPRSLIERVAPAREHLRPAERGAIDALETEVAVGAMRRPSVTTDAEDAQIAKAMAAAEDPRLMSEAMAASVEPSAQPRALPEASGEVMGIHGPMLQLAEFGGDWARLVDHMRELKSGDAPAALSHPEVGPIDVVWGKPDTAEARGYGLAKIVQKHPDVVADLPATIAAMKVQSRSANRIRLEAPERMAVVRLEFDGAAKTWLMTAFEKGGRRGPGTTVRRSGEQTDTSSVSAAASDITPVAREITPFEALKDGEAQTQLLERELADHLDVVLPAETGNGKTLADALEEARKGDAMAAFIEGCKTS